MIFEVTIALTVVRFNKFLFTHLGVPRTVIRDVVPFLQRRDFQDFARNNEILFGFVLLMLQS